MFEKLSIEPSESNKQQTLERQISDKLTLLYNLDPQIADRVCKNAEFVMSTTGRIRNMIDSNGTHLFSPRLAEGGMSLTIDGAKLLHSFRKRKPPVECDAEFGFYPGEGPAWIVVDDDAEPFIRSGRNVMHGFVLACDPWVRPNEDVLVVNSKGELLAFGRSKSTAKEFECFKKGIAVKVREGCSN